MASQSRKIEKEASPIASIYGLSQIIELQIIYSRLVTLFGIQQALFKMPQLAQRGKENQIRTKINQKLTETGERERLQEMLRLKLIECGWREELKSYCRSIIQQKGIDNVTVDDLVDEITPKARAMVPDDVKKELFQRIKTFVTEKSELPS